MLLRHALYRYIYSTGKNEKKNLSADEEIIGCQMSDSLLYEFTEIERYTYTYILRAKNIFSPRNHP